MVRTGVIAIAAIFALIGCTGDDTVVEDDDAAASLDSATRSDTSRDAGCPADASGLFAFPGYCCEAQSRFCSESPADCALNLATAQDAATWIKDTPTYEVGCVYESTNTCNGNIAFRTYGTDFFTTYFFDPGTGALVGFANNVNGGFFCAGEVSPLDCDDYFHPDTNPCCTWQFKTVVQGQLECFGGSDD